MFGTTATADQASGLRRMQAASPPKVIAITGGKGGVGKTMVSVNLGVALARQGLRTLLLDADLGLANFDVALGLQPEGDLSDILAGRRELADVILEGPFGLRVVPAASGVSRMVGLDANEHAGLINAFGELDDPIDYLLVDTAAGISDDVVAFAKAAQEVLVVLCDEPASLTDAYALIKVLSREQDVVRFHVVSNMVRNADHGRTLFRKLAAVSERFLDVVLHYAGAVPLDEGLRKAIQRQQSVLEAFPEAPASSAFRRLVDYVEKWPPPTGPRGDLEFFVERVLAASQAD